MNTFNVDVEILQKHLNVKKSSFERVRKIRSSFSLKGENVFNYKSF